LHNLTNSFKWRELDIEKFLIRAENWNGKFDAIMCRLEESISFKIPLVNKLKWIEDRILQLYLSVNVMKAPPEAERSVACNYFKFKKRCDSDNKG
jgi:hypothetical protein